MFEITLFLHRPKKEPPDLEWQYWNLFFFSFSKGLRNNTSQNFDMAADFDRHYFKPKHSVCKGRVSLTG